MTFRFAMDDSLMDSVFEEGDSLDLAPAKPAKAAKAAKATAAAPKKAAGAGKPRGRPAKDPSQAKPKAKAAPKKKRKDASDDENSDVDMDEDPFGGDESLLADTPPKQKKAPSQKKSNGKPLADIANESFGMDGAEDEPLPKSKKPGGSTSKYQMVQPPHQHFENDY